MGDQSREIRDTAILVLQDCRIEASKKKLACHSRYFECLFFSDLFPDSQNEEFVINYEMSLETLQSFVDWVNDEGEECNIVHSETHHCDVKRSLEKFLFLKYSDMFELLKFSVIFLAEKLTKDLTEMIIIICMHLSLENVFETWLLAEFLNLKVLENIALSICLDRFKEIPIPWLVELPFKNFFNLVCNVNVNSTVQQLMHIRKAWIKGNSPPPNLVDSSLRFIESEPAHVLRAMVKKKIHYVQCATGQHSKGQQLVYAWNGDSLCKLVEFPKEHTAWRFVGRGFYIYVIGRKKGEGVIEFLWTTIWRYCVFTEKWYIETLIPPRRVRMEVVALGSKLYLVGGTDFNDERTFSSMDVYDVYTGEWSVANEPPNAFRPLGPTFSGHGKIWCQRHSVIGVYDPKTDNWRDYDVKAPDWLGVRDNNYTFSMVGVYTNSKFKTPPGVYVRFFSPSLKETAMAILTIIHGHEIYITRIDNWPEIGLGQQHVNGTQILTFNYTKSYASVNVERAYHSQTTGLATYQCLKKYSVEIEDLQSDCFTRHFGYFDLIEANTLHKTITIPECEEIIDDEFTIVDRKRRKNKRGK